MSPALHHGREGIHTMLSCIGSRRMFMKSRLGIHSLLILSPYLFGKGRINRTCARAREARRLKLDLKHQHPLRSDERFTLCTHRQPRKSLSSFAGRLFCQMMSITVLLVVAAFFQLRVSDSATLPFTVSSSNSSSLALLRPGLNLTAPSKNTLPGLSL